MTISCTESRIKMRHWNLLDEAIVMTKCNCDADASRKLLHRSYGNVKEAIRIFHETVRMQNAIRKLEAENASLRKHIDDWEVIYGEQK